MKQLTAKEIAKLHNIPYRRVLELMEAGEIPCNYTITNDGRKYRYTYDKYVNEYINNDFAKIKPQQLSGRILKSKYAIQK